MLMRREGQRAAKPLLGLVVAALQLHEQPETVERRYIARVEFEGTFEHGLGGMSVVRSGGGLKDPTHAMVDVCAGREQGERLLERRDDLIRRAL